MGLSGSGSFTRETPSYTGSSCWQDEEAGGQNIEASRMDHHDNAVATALSTALYRDGQATPTANQPFGGYRATNLGDATARTDAIKAGQVQDAELNTGATGGSSNAYTFTPGIPITAYSQGMWFRVRLSFSNTGAATFNVSGVAAKDIKTLNGADMQSGMLISGQWVTLVYDSGLDDFVAIDLDTGVQTYGSSITYGAAGSMTYTSTTTSLKDYRVTQDVCQFWLRTSGIIGGTPGNYVTASLPITTATDEVFVPVAVDPDGNGLVPGTGRIRSGTDVIEFYTTDRSNWTTGSGRQIVANISYPIG